MEIERSTAAELLEAWRQAALAAELAERLAALASEAADLEPTHPLDSERIAAMAESASRSAERAASAARTGATKVRAWRP